MKAKPARTVAIFFVATPLHYLAARSIALHFEANSRCIVVPYMPVARQLVQERDWDGVAYAPWPRFAPLPGPFGRHRRLLSNLRDVAAAIGQCHTLLIHSPVFDTEAINYFLRGLPPRCGATEMHARVLPDGLMNISRHPLTPIKRAGQALRQLRRLVSPQLDYWSFGGDRIGSDAPFVDRIYTLAGFPHDYPTEKVTALPPLVSDHDHKSSQVTDNSVLLVGQPLVGIGALSPQQHDSIVSAISSWTKAQGISKVLYKAHPRDPNHELRIPESQVLNITEPLESHMATHHYRAVIGVNSTALYLARQIYGPEVSVVSFGNDKVHFKNPDQGKKAAQLMDLLGIQRF
ncbi:polysialyltransferase family glycosyltransferase [Aquabacterium sp.]|uniref:polysialyltransferase family glycosyltransferase n=1 Tax=Aquabacterium sp. TaxID=1872578 RepID=UPI003CFC562A